MEIAHVDTERFTEKAEEALHAAKRLAEKFGQQEIDVEHLLLALLDQDNSLAVQALAKTGATLDAVKIRVQREVERLPRVSGAGSDDRFYLSGRLSKTFARAEEEAKRRKDDHVAEDMLLLAIADGDGTAALILREFGATKEKLASAIDAVRGPHRVTNRAPENTFQALERFGRDLTKMARDNKLDPVIGRDEEIRRVIQVLSRRTKNNP